MTRSPGIKHWLKASLLSAAVLPGAGLFVLRHYLLGLLILMPNLAALAWLLDFYLGQLRDLWYQALAGQLPLDPWIIRKLIFARPTDPATDEWLTRMQWSWLATYLLSIVISGLAGYRLDKREARAARQIHSGSPERSSSPCKPD